MAASYVLKGLARSGSTRRRLATAEALAGAAAANAALLLALDVRRSAGVALALLPAILLLVSVLSTSGRWLLAAVGLSSSIMPISVLGDPLPFTGGTRIFPQDLIIVIALGAWALARLARLQDNGALPMPRLFLPPLALLTVGLLAGVIHGHERYGSSLIGQPLRLVLYAAIAAALADVPVERLYRTLVVVFYVGTVVEAILGVYYLASGQSQTHAAALSTGGTRALALGTAIYLSGGLVLALLNLELPERPARRALHLGIAALALFGIVIAFGRTNYIALALILPVMAVALRRVRRTFAEMLPLLLLPIAVVALVVSLTYPRLWPTIWERISGTSGNDINVVYRERATAATVAGLNKSPLLGMGFGRPVTFEIPNEDPVPLPVYETINDDPHNSYAYILAGGGFVTLAGLASLFIAFAVDSVRRARRTTGRQRVLVLWALGFWFVFAVNAAAGPIFARSDFVLTMWLLMLLPAAVAPTPKAPGPGSSSAALARLS